MLPIALLIAAADPPGAWVPVGVSESRLRVFVERTSVRIDGDRRSARIRIGSPGAIAGPIVVVFQDEEVDCRERRWRLVAYDAHDAAGGVVRAGTSTAPAVPVVAGTIGDAVVRTVCAF